MERRTLLRAALGTAGLAAPRIGRAQGAGVLRFVPYVDLAILDPMVNTASQTRTYGYMVFDTLYAQDGSYRAQPEMVDGHQVEDEHRLWTLTLRDGLRFHDGTPVLARDCVASIRRWMVRDTFGQVLAAQVDELSALDDRRFRFRLKKPFPFLALAMGKSQNPCFVMPERIAATDPFQQIRDATGSGPFRFLADEWNPGQRAVWGRFDGYQPRQEAPDAGSA